MTSGRLFVVKVVVPFLFACGMCAIFYATQSGKFPKDASPEEWKRFTDLVFVNIKNTDDYKIVLLVLVAHFGHTILCIPCVHLTQMLCGYCIGFLYASIVCAACECCIVTVFVHLYAARNRFADENFDKFVTHLRKTNTLFPFIFLSQSSSVPINSTSCVVGSGGVTANEYIYSHYVVSIINSCKCCFLGHQIRIATQKATVLLLGYIIFMISILPTFITLGLWYFTFVIYKTHIHGAATSLSPTHSVAEYMMPPANNSPGQIISHYIFRGSHKYDVIDPAHPANAAKQPVSSDSSVSTLKETTYSGTEDDIVQHSPCLSPRSPTHSPSPLPVSAPEPAALDSCVHVAIDSNQDSSAPPKSGCRVEQICNAELAVLVAGDPHCELGLPAQPKN